jgi:SAM-dependent methyltransferase
MINSSQISLNQTYQSKKTFSDYPEIKRIKDDYENYCLNVAKWHKYGRSYDCALSLFYVDFADKIVCELGARDSIFSSYLTKNSKKVYVSDNFVGWDLGELDYWGKMWRSFAHNESKLICEYQDMKNLQYDNNSMDIVISFSAIEHIPQDGDIKAAIEIGRVCAKNGIIIISTEMCRNHVWISGGYFYDEKTIFDRIINPTGCKLIGGYNFDFDKSDKSFFNGTEYTSVIMFLKKE